MVLSRRIKAVVDVFVVVHLRVRQSVTVYYCLRHEGTSANCANTKSRAGIPKRAGASRCDPSSPVLQHHIFFSSHRIQQDYGSSAWPLFLGLQLVNTALNQYSVQISIHYALFALLDSSTCQSFPETRGETMAIKPSPPG